MRNCYSSEEIDSYLLKRMTEGESRAFEEHYFNCPRCFAELSAREEIVRVIKSRGSEIFAVPAPAPEARPSLAHRVLGFFTPRQWAFVSLAVAALVVIVFWGLPRTRPAPTFVLDGEDIVRGESLTLISPVIDVKGAPSFFEWRSLEGAAEYKVSLFSGSTLLWAASTPDNRIVVPEEVKSQLRPGQKYSWQVKAFSAQGLLISVSSRVHFELSPAAK